MHNHTYISIDISSSSKRASLILPVILVGCEPLQHRVNRRLHRGGRLFQGLTSLVIGADLKLLQLILLCIVGRKINRYRWMVRVVGAFAFCLMAAAAELGTHLQELVSRRHHAERGTNNAGQCPSMILLEAACVGVTRQLVRRRLHHGTEAQ